MSESRQENQNISRSFNRKDLTQEIGFTGDWGKQKARQMMLPQLKRSTAAESCYPIKGTMGGCGVARAGSWGCQAGMKLKKGWVARSGGWKGEAGSWNHIGAAAAAFLVKGEMTYQLPSSCPSVFHRYPPLVKPSQRPAAREPGKCNTEQSAATGWEEGRKTYLRANRQMTSPAIFEEHIQSNGTVCDLDSQLIIVFT